MKKIFYLLIINILSIITPAVVMAQSDVRELTNLVIFVRFADDDEITHSFDAIDTMFNGKADGYLSVYNFYKVMTYDKIHYNTVYTNNIQNGVIVSYQDVYPRGYFEPYSAQNPEGYQGENPFMGVSMREAELLGRIVRYVDSMHLVDSSVVLDGDGDGDIDNISFIVKGGTGAWASILWPHMEYFPHDSRGNVREGPCTVVEADGNICVARSARISLLGVKNLVVVTTPDSVLVADKSRLTDMKKLFKK